MNAKTRKLAIKICDLMAFNCQPLTCCDIAQDLGLAFMNQGDAHDMADQAFKNAPRFANVIPYPKATYLSLARFGQDKEAWGNGRISADRARWAAAAQNLREGWEPGDPDPKWGET